MAVIDSNHSLFLSAPKMNKRQMEEEKKKEKIGKKLRGSIQPYGNRGDREWGARGSVR